MKQMEESELILNPDGSIYHLNLLPDDVAGTIINVGDPGRVPMVSGFFDRVVLKKEKREFVTHTGYYRNKRITVLSTGIGTDNIDIVYNELDALVNIDLAKRTPRERLTRLNLVRIGTSGALQEDVLPGSFVFSRFGIGLDGLLNYYPVQLQPGEQAMTARFREYFPSEGIFPAPHVIGCDPNLKAALSEEMVQGMTASCQGFYGPQGRSLRVRAARHGMIEKLSAFRFGNERITNFEMETGAMYGLARVLGHACCSVNLIVANRLTGQFAQHAKQSMLQLIELVLDRIATSDAFND